ncbi:hypothetical protein HDU86_005868 [Geranomyces michiganensis]|nr:hypothetical protein HDU86_005868 [Geranomyces michiganensis]
MDDEQKKYILDRLGASATTPLRARLFFRRFKLEDRQSAERRFQEVLEDICKTSRVSRPKKHAAAMVLKNINVQFAAATSHWDKQEGKAHNRKMFSDTCKVHSAGSDFLVEDFKSFIDSRKRKMQDAPEEPSKIVCPLQLACASSLSRLIILFNPGQDSRPLSLASQEGGSKIIRSGTACRDLCLRRVDETAEDRSEEVTIPWIFQNDQALVALELRHLFGNVVVANYVGHIGNPLFLTREMVDAVLFLKLTLFSLSRLQLRLSPSEKGKIKHATARIAWLCQEAKAGECALSDLAIDKAQAVCRSANSRPASDPEQAAKSRVSAATGFTSNPNQAAKSPSAQNGFTDFDQQTGKGSKIPGGSRFQKAKATPGEDWANLPFFLSSWTMQIREQLPLRSHKLLKVVGGSNVRVESMKGLMLRWQNRS